MNTTTISAGRRRETQHMIHLACDLFKKWYADYPKRIGLDYRSRYRERPYGDFYRVMDPIRTSITNFFTVPTTDIPSSLYPTFRQTEIRIDPAYIADDEILCEWENTTVKMTFVFTEHGYHCICQEMKNKGEHIHEYTTYP